MNDEKITALDIYNHELYILNSKKNISNLEKMADDSYKECLKHTLYKVGNDSSSSKFWEVYDTISEGFSTRSYDE